MQAEESSHRIFEKREALQEGSTQQLRQETELRMAETNGELGRLRKRVEAELRTLNDTTKNKIRERDGHMQQLDAVIRSTILQLKTTEERSIALQQELKAGIERRLGIMSEGIARNNQAVLERLLGLERVVDREASERLKEDVEIRQELEGVIQAVKNTAIAEASERSELHRLLHGEVMDLSKVAKSLLLCDAPAA